MKQNDGASGSQAGATGRVSGREPGRRIVLGKSGEDRAAQWYVQHGFRVIERNWRCREGEIDLIVEADNTLVICEVKTRTSNRFGSPAEAVTLRKQRRLRQLGAIYLAQCRAEKADGAEGAGYWALVRFDVACVMGDTVHVITNAF